MPHVSNNIGHEFDDPIQPTTAPVLTSERQDQSQQASETFRGPEFGEELDRSRSLSENFPEQILDFLGPLLIPQQRASARGRRNLIDTFRRTGGLKSSFAGQRFQEFERDASLNEILGLVTGAKSFFGPLAALQQNRLAVAGAPLSRSKGTSSGSSRSFGFPPQAGGITDLGPRGGDFGSAAENQLGLTSRLPASGGGGGTFRPSGGVENDINSLLASNPDLFGSRPFIDSAPVASGGSGGGGIFFNPATGTAESTGGSSRGFNQDIPNFDQDFSQGL